jgi:hypothetical protein
MCVEQDPDLRHFSDTAAGKADRSKKQATIRGLNRDYNHDLKGGLTVRPPGPVVKPGPLWEFYQRSLAKGIIRARAS